MCAGAGAAVSVDAAAVAVDRIDTSSGDCRHHVTVMSAAEKHLGPNTGSSMEDSRAEPGHCMADLEVAGKNWPQEAGQMHWSEAAIVGIVARPEIH